ncbi:MAG: 4-alpha-glucanotransferase [Rubrivivax sp.]|nr:4-alpha-glucanotransferase [Rubrivivax sp.]
MPLSGRRSGVLLHPTSLPGPHGAGDLGPAAWRCVEWLARAGQTLWQWLPTTPLGPGDSPYQSLSAFAGDPGLVALEPLVEAGWLRADLAPPAFAADRCEHGRTGAWRLERLRQALRGHDARATAADREAFERWCAAQRHWLDDYARFMALRTQHGNAPWWAWPGGARPEPAEVRYWRFVQWCFDVQLQALRRHAHAHGVHLVGDLPIFIAHDSADVWARPDLYQLDAAGQPTVVAGVPPDDLGPLGQRWGNPLYRWDRMAAEGHAWWIARMRRLLEQVDAVRIDHFRGFAAHWEIPAASPTAQQGRWVEGPGRSLFDAMTAALGPMPILAEDLGYITPDVLALRDAYGYPGMKILQFAFGTDGTHEFLPHNYAANCVVYTGTHDNDTARGWWDHAPEHERRYAATYLDCDADSVAWQMVAAASRSVARLAIFPPQDLLGLPSTSRLNTPGTLGPSNWTWRLQAEQLDARLADRLARLTAAAGRCDIGRLHG